MGRRRTVTVLFTDLVDSTETLLRLGPDAEAVQRRHFAELRRALALHGGEEVKTLGDGLMATFAAAGDAVACAISMQRAVTRERAVALRMRVGLSAGDARCDAGDFFGAPVVEASRLCHVARPGQTLASEAVRLLAAAPVDALEPAGELELKGLPEPLRAWSVRHDGAEQRLRVALAEDSTLLRQGIAQVLEAQGFEVVLSVGDADALLQGLAAARPHAVLCDVRMPPTYTREGLDAALRVKALHPEVGVVVLSAKLELEAARTLSTCGASGIGYLLTERVGDVAELAAAVRDVAAGSAVFDDDIVTQLAA